MDHSTMDMGMQHVAAAPVALITAWPLWLAC